MTIAVGMIDAPILAPVMAASGSGSLATEVRWGWPWSPLAAAIVTVAAVGWIVAVYSREQAFVPAGTRVVMAALRLIAAAALAVMIAGPMLVPRRVAPPRIVVLVDRSASMAVRDGDGGSATRIDVWRQILHRGAAPLLAELEKSYEVVLVAFAGEPQLVTNGEEQDGADGGGRFLGAVEPAPAAEGSWLGDTIDFAIRELPGSRPAAVIALTDGIVTGGMPLVEAAERARTVGVPIYAVGIGSDRPRADVAVDSATAEEVVFPGDRLQVEASIRSTGFEGRSATVAMVDAETSELLAESVVELPGDGRTTVARLALRPTSPGVMRLRIEVDEFNGEEDKSNNRQDLEVRVREEKIRVLLAASLPSFEYRALKSLLGRDPAVDLDVWLEDADAGYADVDSSAIATFPSAGSELEQYHVLVVNDLDPRALTMETWSRVFTFVAAEGGGVVLSAGPRWLPEAYGRIDVMRTLLPFELGRLETRLAEGGDEGYAIRPTAAGDDAALLQLGATPAESAAVWEKLPPVHWMVACDEVKPGVQTLAEAHGRGGQRMPAVMRQYVGAGEALFHATDETWRWRWRNDDRYFARYWGQAVRRLARGKMSRGSPSLTADRREYALGESVRLHARLRSAVHQRDGGSKVKLEAEGQSPRYVDLSRNDSQRDLFEETIADLPAGRYTGTLLVAGEAIGAQVAFTVTAPPGEMTELTMNSAGLAEIAQATGGRYYTVDAAGRLPGELPPPRPVAIEELPAKPLISSHWLVGVLCAALGCEWLLRRRSGML